MSFDSNWDIDKYREEHESDEHWQLRRAFLERWKNDYDEERLVCLARVFANMELLGCRYPVQVMQEVARLSNDVAKAYRNARKDKLKRTFVSASDAAEDRAKGIKREGGVIKDTPPPKNKKINFVPQGQSNSEEIIVSSDSETEINEEEKETKNNLHGNVIEQHGNTAQNTIDGSTTENDGNTEQKAIESRTDYWSELSRIKCLDIQSFNESMFMTTFGRMVLLVRPWASKSCNIQSSCQACNIAVTNTFVNGCYTLQLNGKLLAQATGATKAEAKSVVEAMAWNRLRGEVISLLIKEQFIAQGNSTIKVKDISRGRNEDAFGTPVENTVAMKMMKLMGWKGGGLGVEAQGIAEPIKPNLQMVNRSGLGSQTTSVQQLRRAAQSLMERYKTSDLVDIDLVFSSEFSKEERAQLHQCAQRAGLASRSYGADTDRFLVVKKKLDPFSLVRAVVEKDGNTPKYQVFIPEGLGRANGR